MSRLYQAPDKLPGETNEEWCRRYASLIPPEALLTEMIDTMHRLRTRRGVVWGQIGKLTGHGGGVSSAIVERYMTKPIPDDATR